MTLIKGLQVNVPDSPHCKLRAVDSALPKTYGQIIKSSVLIGGSSVLNIGVGIVRTKAMALMLGPEGVGLIGVYTSIVDFARSLAGMGITSSGVRQIADAVGTGDNSQVAKTVSTLRRVTVLLGALGALLVGLLCRPISRLTFGDVRHQGPIGLLALVVFFSIVSGGQLALVQGMRRIADLARSNVIGGLSGTFFSILIVYFFEKSGVVPALVCAAAMGMLASWWFARKITVERVLMKLTDLSLEVSTLLKLGFVFMMSGLMGMGVAYLVRAIVLREMGEEAAGFYQAAWTLGGLYVGFILQAMGSDFFPRLTAVARNNDQCNRLVNEQAEVSLLMAGPGIIGTLTFAPLVIQLFYSFRFGPSVELLRWICLGMILRVASWPMGFILLAKNSTRAYFWTEFASYTVQVLLLCLLVAVFGLKGSVIAFFVQYIFYWCLIYIVVRFVSGFRWSPANKRLGLLYCLVVPAIFFGGYFLPAAIFMALGLFATVAISLHSLKHLANLVGSESLPRPAHRVLGLFRSNRTSAK
jgi:PST family polysaccharide transporter